MPYHQIEQIHERKGEKVAFLLTAENTMGLVVGAMPLYLLTGSVPLLLRALVIILGAILGVVATLEIGGLTPVERILWLIRGVIRTQLQSAYLTPEHLPGAVQVQHSERVLQHGGPIQIVARVGPGGRPISPDRNAQ